MIPEMHIGPPVYASVMMWTVRDVRYFVTVADANSFTDAAYDLGVSQAAVSRGISALEQRLGDRLLRRTPHGCELSAFGAELLPQARRVLAELSKLDELALTRHTRLRLGYAWAAVGAHTTPLLRNWPRDHPEVELQLVRHNSHTAGLLEGFCDVAVVRTPVEESRFDSVVIGLERRVAAFAADDAEWRRRRTLTMAEIARRTLVLDPRTGTTTPDLWRSDDRPTTVVETSHVEEWLDAIATGRAVGTTSEATASHHPRSGISYRPIKDGPRVPVYLTWWRGDSPGGLAALIETLTALYSGPRGAVGR